jgi:hypothetical protein
MRSSGDKPALNRDDRLRIDALADEFERSIKAGQSPRIEDFLDRIDEGARLAAMRELLEIEIELRRDAPGCERNNQSDLRLATIEHDKAGLPTNDVATRPRYDSDTGSGRL